jgi:hypothetical protein
MGGRASRIGINQSAFNHLEKSQLPEQSVTGTAIRLIPKNFSHLFFG